MNRRSFLIGMFGAAAAAALPPTAILETISTRDWETAMEKIWQTYFDDFVVFGMAAITTCEEFPFIRNVPYEEFLKIPELYRSTGEY